MLATFYLLRLARQCPRITRLGVALGAFSPSQVNPMLHGIYPFLIRHRDPPQFVSGFLPFAGKRNTSKICCHNWKCCSSLFQRLCAFCRYALRGCWRACKTAHLWVPKMARSRVGVGRGSWAGLVAGKGEKQASLASSLNEVGAMFDNDKRVLVRHYPEQGVRRAEPTVRFASRLVWSAAIHRAGFEPRAARGWPQSRRRCRRRRGSLVQRYVEHCQLTVESTFQSRRLVLQFEQGVHVVADLSACWTRSASVRSRRPSKLRSTCSSPPDGPHSPAASSTVRSSSHRDA